MLKTMKGAAQALRTLGRIAMRPQSQKSRMVHAGQQVARWTSSATSARTVRCALVATAGATVFAASNYTYARDVLNARDHDVAEPMLKAILAVYPVLACKNGGGSATGLSRLYAVKDKISIDHRAPNMDL